MPYRARLHIRNPGPGPLRAVIYGGTIFEVPASDSEVQSLAAIEDTEVTLGPGESRVVEIDIGCLNQDDRSPSDTPTQPTSRATSRPCRSQQDLWREIARLR